MLQRRKQYNDKIRRIYKGNEEIVQKEATLKIQEETIEAIKATIADFETKLKSISTDLSKIEMSIVEKNINIRRQEISIKQKKISPIQIFPSMTSINREEIAKNQCDPKKEAKTIAKQESIVDEELLDIWKQQEIESVLRETKEILLKNIEDSKKNLEEYKL